MDYTNIIVFIIILVLSFLSLCKLNENLPLYIQVYLRHPISFLGLFLFVLIYGSLFILLYMMTLDAWNIYHNWPIISEVPEVGPNVYSESIVIERPLTPETSVTNSVKLEENKTSNNTELETASNTIDQIVSEERQGPNVLLALFVFKFCVISISCLFK